jgi:lysophospholipid acyltransferase
MFLLGGFVTAVARLARANIRPLLLPAPSRSPSLVKRVYDILGTFTSTIILNYVAAPFMLLNLKDSITAWSRLGFYGHFIIFGGLIFFYSGGTKYLRGLQKKRGLHLANGKASGTSTPVQEKNVILPPGLDELLPAQK